MATINNNNVQLYIDKGLIDPSKIKIDLNVTKTANDNYHQWVTLSEAIKSGYDFNFDYDVPEIKTPKVTQLPELEVTASKSGITEPQTAFSPSIIDMQQERNYNPKVEEALNSMGNTWMFHPQDYIYHGYFNSDTHNNVREGGNMAARYVTDIVTLPFAGKTIWNTGKGLLQGAKGLKALYKMWKFNPVHGAYETIRVATPIVTSIYGGIKGTELVDQGMKAFNGKTWGENIQELTGYPSIVAESTNPGAALFGFGGYKLADNYLRGVENRAIEMAMRTTSTANPRYHLKWGLDWMRKHPFSQITRDRIKYLFTGLKGKKSYNTLALPNQRPYTGEMELNLDKGTPVDLAVGRSTEPHPSIGKLADDSDLGPLTSYVEESPNYKGRTKIIDVEAAKLPDVHSGNVDLPPITEEEIAAGKVIGGENSFYTSKGARINTAGHQIQLRLNPEIGQPEYRRFDIWKFNPEDYWYRWIDNGEISTKAWNAATLAEKKAILKPIVNRNWSNRIIDAGLRVVDSRITPYVYRTNWLPYPSSKFIPKVKGRFLDDPSLYSTVDFSKFGKFF